MRYNYSENILGPHFREDITKQIRVLIDTGSSFNIIGMPFVGISPFFRYLATTDIAYVAYIDVHSLISRTKEELYLAIYNEIGGNKKVSSIDAYNECHKLLKDLLKKHERIFIMINRFDYLEKNEFSNGVFTNLKALEDIGKGRIIFVVASHKPLYEIDQKGIIDSNLAFLSKIIYFKPYVGEDLRKLLRVSPVALKPDKNDLKKALILSGGHATLLQVLIKTDCLDNPIEDPFIKLHLKLIYDTCNAKQKNCLYNIAVGRKVNMIDPYVLRVGILKKYGNNYTFFSPLFRDYVILFGKLKLTKKEKILFYLLKKRVGHFIDKEIIFQEVWKEEYENATDWALNSLIYRLRKNPTVVNKYSIESNKGVGYRMTKEV